MTLRREQAAVSKKKRRRRQATRQTLQAQFARERERELQSRADAEPTPPQSWSGEALRVLGLLLQDPLLQLLLGTVLAAAVGLVQAIAGHLTAIAFLLASQRVGGSYALLAASFQVVNSIWRIYLRHWTTNWQLTRKLLVEVFVCAVIPLAIAAVAFGFQQSVLTALLLPLIYFAFSLAYEPIETSIYQAVETLGLRHGTEAVANVGGLGARVSGRRTPTIKLIAWLLTRDTGEISRIRRLIIAGSMIFLVVSFCGAISALASGDKLPFVPARPHLLESHNSSKARATKKKTQHRTKKKQNTKLETWTSLCPSLPGDGAPSWAKQDIYDLYLGNGGFGAIQAGCTLSVFTRNGFTYVLAYRRGQLQSIAVDSFAYGAAIYLRPAAAQVLALVEEYGVLGGPTRIDVGGGDVYVIHTSAGTVTLLRDEKHPIGQPKIATQYAELPAPVTAAWIAAMKLHNEWLWPLEPTQVSHDLTMYALVHNAVTKTFVENVQFSAATQRAYGQLSGMSGGAWTPYDGGMLFEENEVRSLAELEPKPPRQRG